MDDARHVPLRPLDSGRDFKRGLTLPRRRLEQKRGNHGWASAMREMKERLSNMGTGTFPWSLEVNSIALPKILPSFLPSFLPNFSSQVTLKKFTKWKFGHVSKLGRKLGRIFGSAIELTSWITATSGSTRHVRAAGTKRIDSMGKIRGF